MAWSPRVSTLRPRWSPVATMSIHATEYRWRWSPVSIRSSRRSRFGTRSCRTRHRLVSIGSSRTVASRTIPVSPMPPMVAQNSSGSVAGAIARRRAVGEQHRHRVDVGAERAVDVVVLAVDVARDRTADGDEPGAGRAPARRTRAARCARSSSSRLTPAATVTVPARESSTHRRRVRVAATSAAGVLCRRRRSCDRARGR